MSTGKPTQHNQDPTLQAREQRRALLLSNPNHFGNLKGSSFAPVLQVVHNTDFEQLTCVGLHTRLGLLEAVFVIKKAAGYKGGLCKEGSREYVRFYLSFDDGTTWTDEGAVSCPVHDIPQGAHQVHYAVSLKIDPKRKLCFQGAQTPRVRAILRWDQAPPPNDPDFSPEWGNVVDVHVQIDALKLVPLDVLFDAIKPSVKIPLQEVFNPEQVVAVAPREASLASLHDDYKKAGVSAHRFAFPMIKKAAANGLALPLEALAKVGVSLGTVDIPGLLFPTQGNTTFEELRCVGYDPQTDVLEAIVRVKRSSGYMGGLCTSGSKEFVAFYADLNGDGTFETHLGTTAVVVHDIATLPEGGLDYAVTLPAGLLAHRKPCKKGAVVIPIRAVLSWATEPTSATDVPHWGNHRDARVQVAPGQEIQEGTVTPILTIVGSVAAGDINNTGLTKPGATVVAGGAALDESPFGGFIKLQGSLLNVPAGTLYRIMKKRDTDPTWTPVTAVHPLVFRIPDPILGTVQLPPQAPQPGGYYAYEPRDIEHLLMVWQTLGDHGLGDDGGLFGLRVDVQVPGQPDQASNEVWVRIDNTSPDITQLVINTTGGPCADLHPGDTLFGKFGVTDAWFHTIAWVLHPEINSGVGVVPTSPSPPPTPWIDGYGPSTATGYATGTPYALHTTGMAPCGYSLTLTVSDKTNVDSGARNHHTEKSVGFCIKMP